MIPRARKVLTKGDPIVSVVWGVVCSEEVTEELYNCVLENFGKPQFWGRYLTTVAGASEGLTRTEIDLLHNSGTKILPIYNDFRSATGYTSGRIIARNAIFHARRLGIPENTVLFANIEKFFSVHADWIRGYVDAIYPSGYRPGIYHDPENGDFATAYCQAVEADTKVSAQLILWSADPHPGATKATEAPDYHPSQPLCEANVWAWQYGRDTETCPIDTNLIDRRLFDLLW